MKEQIVKEWIERGKHDLEVAKILLAEEEYSDVVLFHWSSVKGLDLFYQYRFTNNLKFFIII
jgi:hypothetical protein